MKLPADDICKKLKTSVKRRRACAPVRDVGKRMHPSKYTHCNIMSETRFFALATQPTSKQARCHLLNCSSSPDRWVTKRQDVIHGRCSFYFLASVYRGFVPAEIGARWRRRTLFVYDHIMKLETIAHAYYVIII